MKLKLQERGQSLVLIALAVIGLFGFSALAIDGSRVFSDRRNAQNAADTAALSAALAKIRGEVYTDAAVDRAESNGYANDANSTVEVHLCSELPNDDCPGIPQPESTPPTESELIRANRANYIHVKITSILPATFARIVGRNEFKNIVTAVTYAGPVEPKPLADGYALAAMELHERDAIHHGGNFNLEVNNSGIYSNSDYLDSSPGPNCPHGSIVGRGNGNISVDTSIRTAGDFCAGNNFDIYPLNAVDDRVSQIPLPLPVDIPDFSCSGTAAPPSYDAANFLLTYYPGNYNSLDINNGTGGNPVQKVHFSPGTYCISNGASFSGPQFIANDVDFLVTGGDFRFSGGTFTCNDMQVHIDGGSGIRMGATSHMYCNNVTFFLSTGDVDWNGNPDFRIFAPTGGDYKGLLFYMAPDNNNSIRINGNTHSEMTGTILAVSSNITINGDSWSNGLRSQIIGDTVTLLGNGNMVINYDPDDQFQPIDPSAITLNK